MFNLRPCPNRTPRLINQDYEHYKAIRRVQHPLGPHSIHASRSASWHSHTVSPSSHLPQTVASTSQGGGDPDLPPDPAQEPESDKSASEEEVSKPEPTLHGWAADRRQAPLGPDTPLFGSRILPSTSTQSPNTLISPSTLFDTFDGARFAPSHTDVAGLSRLGIEPRGMPSMTATGPKWPYVALHLRIQHDVTLPMDLVAWSLLDGDAHMWATPFFAQLVLVQIGTQGATTPFANEAAFATAFKACFGNLNDKAAAQVELAKLCADKSLHEKCTAVEFSALFKGLADQSGYGDHDKYLSGIPSRVYRKIDLETFTT
ncbi:predicted protein [Postia placenta Mad-698-R]|nr:predicted protein [Postia placenta Mad-698-R]